jgi:ABC-type uncharacterized transport system permease subunit
MKKKILFGIVGPLLIGAIGGVVLYYAGVSSPWVGVICGGLGGIIFVSVFASVAGPKA